MSARRTSTRRRPASEAARASARRKTLSESAKRQTVGTSSKTRLSVQSEPAQEQPSGLNTKTDLSVQSQAAKKEPASARSHARSSVQSKPAKKQCNDISPETGSSIQSEPANDSTSPETDSIIQLETDKQQLRSTGPESGLSVQPSSINLEADLSVQSPAEQPPANMAPETGLSVKSEPNCKQSLRMSPELGPSMQSSAEQPPANMNPETGLTVQSEPHCKQSLSMSPEMGSSIQSSTDNLPAGTRAKTGLSIQSVIRRFPWGRKGKRKAKETISLLQNDETEQATPVDPPESRPGKNQHTVIDPKKGFSIQSVIPTLPWRRKGKRKGKHAADKDLKTGICKNHEADEISALEHFHISLTAIRKHCRENRLFTAMLALKALETEVVNSRNSAAHKKPDGELDLIVKFSNALTNDAELIKLKSIHSRFDPYLQPDGLLAIAQRGSESTWTSTTRREPRLGEHFYVECKMRFLEPSERTEGGGATQVMFCIKLANWPQKLEEFVALDRETDLFHKDLFEDCKHYHGVAGGHDLLLSSMLYYVIRPALLPFSFANLMVREFAVCHENPLSGYAPGILVSENTPPVSGGVEYEGFQMPPDRWATTKVVRETIKHFAPSPDHSGYSQVITVSKAGVPLPQWMIPLTLINTIVLNTLLKTMLNFKLHLVDRWDETGFAKRMLDTPEFYEAVRKLHTGAADAASAPFPTHSDALSACGNASPTDSLDAKVSNGVAEPDSYCTMM